MSESAHLLFVLVRILILIPLCVCVCVMCTQRAVIRCCDQPCFEVTMPFIRRCPVHCIRHFASNLCDAKHFSSYFFFAFLVPFAVLLVPKTFSTNQRLCHPTLHIHKQKSRAPIHISWKRFSTIAVDKHQFISTFMGFHFPNENPISTFG